MINLRQSVPSSPLSFTDCKHWNDIKTGYTRENDLSHVVYLQFFTSWVLIEISLLSCISEAGWAKLGKAGQACISQVMNRMRRKAICNPLEFDAAQSPPQLRNTIEEAGTADSQYRQDDRP